MGDVQTSHAEVETLLADNAKLSTAYLALRVRELERRIVVVELLAKRVEQVEADIVAITNRMNKAAEVVKALKRFQDEKGIG